jgi:hypothetical protein
MHACRSTGRRRSPPLVSVLLRGQLHQQAEVGQGRCGLEEPGNEPERDAELISAALQPGERPAHVRVLNEEHRHICGGPGRREGDECHQLQERLAYIIYMDACMAYIDRASLASQV